MSENILCTTANSKLERILEKSRSNGYVALSWFNLIKNVTQKSADDEFFNHYAFDKVSVKELGGLTNYLATHFRTAISQVFV